METIYYDVVLKGAINDLRGCRSPEVLVEGPAGTGKTSGILLYLVEMCETWPGLRILICRATRVSMTESVLVTLETKVLPPFHSALTAVTRAGRRSYDFPNGSTIVVGGLDSPESLYSTEWDFVYVAEATEISEDSWEKFARAMRNGKGPFHQRIADCNPSAPGHWLNKRAKTSKMARLISRHADNPSLTEEYLDALKALSGHRRARLFEGRWVSAEGGVYPEFSESRNCKPRFNLPPDWPIITGVDPGYDHPCAWLWFAVAPNDHLYIVDAIVGSGIDIPQLAKRVRQVEADRGWERQIRKRFGDPQDVNASRQVSPKSFKSQLADLGLVISNWPRTQTAGMDSMVSAVRQRWIAETLWILSDLQPVIEPVQGWQYVRTTSGEHTKTDGDKYEQTCKDVNDVIRGVVASNPTFEYKASEVHDR